MSAQRPSSPSHPVALALFALLLIGLGFISGYGTGVGVRQNETPPAPVATLTPAAPALKGLHASPDDRYLAFTGVYGGARQASRFLVDIKSGRFSAVETPTGWQDYITQWSDDGQRILFERERIPRPVAEATAGLYAETITPGTAGAAPAHGEPGLLTQGVDIPGEKIATGFWTPGGALAIKTRREPKNLYVLDNGALRLVDRAAQNFQQHRAVRENGQLVFYTVRDVPGAAPGTVALFRVQNGQERQLSSAFTNLSWAYLGYDARRLVLCRQHPNNIDWQWTLYDITAKGTVKRAEAKLPGDIITVYWSPDGRSILGASGTQLWLVSLPSLQCRALANRPDAPQWNADDACWLTRQNAVVVAAQGIIYKVPLSGTPQQIWRFPNNYWQ